jgi:hypothetical protein
MSMKQVLIDLNCFLGQYRRWCPRLVRQGNRRILELLLLALSSSTGWLGWGSTQLLVTEVTGVDCEEVVYKYLRLNIFKSRHMAWFLMPAGLRKWMPEGVMTPRAFNNWENENTFNRIVIQN